MALQRVAPHPDRTVLKEDGTRMTGPSVVDTSRPYYKNRLRDEDITLVKKQVDKPADKPAPEKKVEKS